MTMKEMQKSVYQNKVDRNWNVSNIEKELCLMQGEITEFYEAYKKHLPSVGEELADVAIYLLGIAQILNIDLAEETERKIAINQHRNYEYIDGVLTRMDD